MEDLLDRVRVLFQRQPIDSDWRNTERKRAEGDRTSRRVIKEAGNYREE